jgi:S1-C subfamily serine protease
MDTASSADGMISQQDVAFAIPINKAMAVARQIVAGRPGPAA